MHTLRARLARWVDEWKLALAGVGLASRSWRFWLVFALVFVLFGTLLCLISTPSLSVQSSFEYWFNLPNLGRKITYLGETFLGLFGYRRESPADFVPILVITILQAFIIALIALVWKKRQRARRLAKDNAKTATNTAGHLSKAGIATGLAVLAGGCPTCGTSLLAPVLAALFSGGSAVIGDIVSWGLLVLAILVALFSFKKVGLEAYVIIVSERRSRQHEKKHCS